MKNGFFQMTGNWHEYNKRMWNFGLAGLRQHPLKHSGRVSKVTLYILADK